MAIVYKCLCCKDTQDQETLYRCKLPKGHPRENTRPFILCAECCEEKGFQKGEALT